MLSLPLSRSFSRSFPHVLDTGRKRENLINARIFSAAGELTAKIVAYDGKRESPGGFRSIRDGTTSRHFNFLVAIVSALI